MDCLNRLGYGIVIKVRPATKRANHLKQALVKSIVCVNRGNTDPFATRKICFAQPRFIRRDGIVLALPR